MTKGKKHKQRIRAKAEASGMSYAAVQRLGAVKADDDDTRSGSESNPFRAAELRREQFRAASLSSWKRVVGSFGSDRLWRNPARIADVLSRVALQAMTNHTHFPDGGGLDLSSARMAGEPGCLDLGFQDDSAHAIVKPRVLTLVRFEADPLDEWAYFRLDLNPLLARDDGEGSELNEHGVEYWSEPQPGRYVERDDDGDGGRDVLRYLRGAFLVIPKASTYNAMPGTYDGRHSKMSADEFQTYIEDFIATLHAHGHYGVDPRGA